jgi:hypothetical protein
MGAGFLLTVAFHSRSSSGFGCSLCTPMIVEEGEHSRARPWVPGHKSGSEGHLRGAGQTEAGLPHQSLAMDAGLCVNVEARARVEFSRAGAVLFRA